MVGCLALNCFAGSSGPKASINSVQKQSGENDQDEDIEILKINTVQSSRPFDSTIRISIQLEDKNDKIAWGYMEQDHSVGRVGGGSYKGAKPNGTINWRFEAGSNSLKRPKIKAYTVEYGYKKSGKFIVLDEDMYKTDSFDELKDANKESLKLKTSLRATTWVER